MSGTIAATMISLGKGRASRGLMAVGAGLLICFAMPPWGWWPLALVGIGLWSLLLDDRWRSRFWIGAGVGLGWFLPSTVWMVKFSPAGWPLGVAVWFPLVIGAASALCPPGPWRFVGLPATVALSEWFRWHAPFGGVPLSMLAMTQSRGPLLPVARVLGSLGVTLAVMVTGAALGALLARRTRIGIILLAAVAMAAAVGVIAPKGRSIGTLRVAAVQGGGPQETRQAPGQAPIVFARHLEASEKISDRVELVVWPENVVNVTRYEGSVEQQRLVDLARRLDASLLVGIVESADDDRHFRNAVVAIAPDGTQTGRFDKVRRVPFGEYVPLRALLEPLAGAQLPPRDAVPGEDPPLLDTSQASVGVVVSWEVFFPRRVRAGERAGAELIANPTNGSSYWLTIVQSQQIASSALRAVESGRWVIQAAPTGFSAIVDPAGNVVVRTGVSEQAVLERLIERRQGATLASLGGDVPTLVIAGMMLGLVWVGLLRSGRPVPGHRHSAESP